MGIQVYIGGLSDAACERDIEELFAGYGEIRNVVVKKGYGFAFFEIYQDAKNAVTNLNGINFCGNRVTIQFVRKNFTFNARGRGGSSRTNPRGRGGSSRPFRVVVENVASSVSWQDLKDFMKPAGQVIFGDAHKPKRNEGVVDFATEAQMENAIETFNNVELDGRRLRLRREDRAHTSRSWANDDSSRGSTYKMNRRDDEDEEEKIVNSDLEDQLLRLTSENERLSRENVRLSRENVRLTRENVDRSRSRSRSRHNNDSSPRSTFGSAATEAEEENVNVLVDEHFVSSKINDRLLRLSRKNVDRSRSRVGYIPPPRYTFESESHLSNCSPPRSSYRSRSPLKSYRPDNFWQS